MLSIVFRCLIVAAFLFSFTSSYSQSGWFWQNPLPQGNDITSVCFINSTTGYAAGEYGTLLKTTDRGNSFTKKYLNTFSSIYKIYFYNETTGYITGEDNLLLRSTDGGNTWVSQSLGNVIEYVNTVYFINAQTGFVTGSGKVAKTINGGLNWIIKLSPTSNYNFHDVHFLNSNTGVIIGPEYYYRTTDCGENWNYSYMYGYYLTDITFTGNIGIIVGDRGCIYRSTNNGTGWQMIDTGNYNSVLNCVMFPTSNTGYVCGTGGKIKKSTNGGLNWFEQNSGVTDELKTIYFIDDNTGVSLGKNGVILITTNGGDIWTKTSSYVTISNLICMSFINDQSGYIGGTNSTILRTSNGGNEWTPVNIVSQGAIISMCFTDYYTGYVSDGCGFLHKTTNAGINWIIQMENSFNYTTKFINHNTGFIGTAGSTIYKTTNEGNNWNAYSLPEINKIVFEICFSSSNTGYAAGGGSMNTDTGFIYKTTDCGSNWYKLNIDAGKQIMALFFTDDNTGFAGGYDNTNYNNIILKTTNGGSNWIFASYVASSITCLSFINSLTGYVSSSNIYQWDKIYKTTNGGYNWYVSPNGASNSISRLYFADGNKGYAIGKDGIILKTTTGGVPIAVEPIGTKVPKEYCLHQNYPNPFNPSTKIKVSLGPSPAIGGINSGGKQDVKLIIYDVMGREIAVFTPPLWGGREGLLWEVEWNASEFASGVYFYRLITSDYNECRKMVLIK